jgi:hypothetical protein
LKIFIYAILFITSLQSQELSPIPLPKTEILTRYGQECSEICLEKHLEKGDVFSFLSYSKNTLENLELEEKRRFYQTLLNVSSKVKNAFVKIALIIPDKKIGSYSLSVSKSTFAYLLGRKIPFKIENYYVELEDNSSIQKVLNTISTDGYSFVVAPFTETGAKVLSKLDTELYIYIPTINSKKVETSNNNLFFGGIDYEAQIDELLTYLDVNNSVSIFFDDSKKGEELKDSVLHSLKKVGNSAKIKRSYRVKKENSNFNTFFSKKHFRNQYFLNTNLLKSSLILSQMTANEEVPAIVLSTQINYSPTIMSMTQISDRRNFLIANSISSKIHRDILNANSILENDIKYNWVNYSTAVGVDYFFSLITGQERYFQELLINNQIVYKIRIMKPQKAKFVEVKKRY